MSGRRAAFVAPQIVIIAVALTHLGFRSGSYRATRPEGGTQLRDTFTADGHLTLLDGIPLCGDVGYSRASSTLFRGGLSATGIVDDRAVVPFLQTLLGAGFYGSLGAGILLNVLVLGAACACAVDLAFRLGRDAVTAGAFGCLLAGCRGVGFNVGMPDSHTFGFVWIPIAAWLYERLDLGAPDTPARHAVLFGIAGGVALLTYLGDIAVLGFLWLYGLGRTPFRRLVVATAIALVAFRAWRFFGSMAGLEFESYSTDDVPKGLLRIARELATAAVDPSFRRQHAPEIVSYFTKALVPGFGAPVLAVGAAGLLAARWRERRLAVALFLPGIAAAFPMNVGYDSPRFSYQAVGGLLLAVAFAIGAAGTAAGRLGGLLGLGERGRAVVAVAASALGVAAFLLYENSDVFGPPHIFKELMAGMV